ncbi:hypothetical protein LRAMOSA01472 [Lichtheimia ramosa]|uniref:Uncharacterized protein n=1 Tax=Lichtheimia ramosa TaxID=688394 RepID=A0A077WK98_9FUNG|nr:hypothetical protein LRAMOSA01472 [Lichtheimia ramosa]
MVSFTKTLGFLLMAGLAMAQDTGDIVYPTEGTVWKVGQHVNVTFKETHPPVETVSIFFANDRSVTLGGGALSQTNVFPFDVPAGAVSPEGGTSLLLAVRRENLHLQNVDAVNVKVVA